MDTNQYKDIFISEAREHLETLNDSLLSLEKDSNNQDIINNIFRAFHTLKGNSATMGYNKFSELAHHLEDLLNKVRDGAVSIDSEIMDLLLEGCDVLEDGLNKISKDDPENIVIDGLVTHLTKLLNEPKKEKVVLTEDMTLTTVDNKKIDKLKKKYPTLLRVIPIFDKANLLKSAKAQITLRNLQKLGKIIKTNPKIDEIKQGNFDSEIDLIFVTDKNKEDIEKEVMSISGIKGVKILNSDEKYEKTVHEKHVQKEENKKEITQVHKDNSVKQIQSVRVNMNKLDKLMNLVGELLINNIRLQEINKRHNISELKSILAELDRLTLDLQDEVMEIRMVPIGNIFSRFPRMVRDLAKVENKKVDFVIEGDEIEFDRTVLDTIGDPIVHLLRNCVDHGIEPPKERVELGKEETGLIKLIARREKNNAVIEVLDDGYGIDPVKLKQSAIKKKFMGEDELNKLTDNELQMLIFKPGFSTNQVVTEVSGRGVGMDVVETKVKELGGNVKLLSDVGKGTSVILELPLTVAIITALLVKVNKQTYAIPLTNVDETVDVEQKAIKKIQGNHVFILRNKEIPLFWVDELLNIPKQERKEKLTVIVVNRKDEKIGLVVDGIESQQQILIKALEGIVKGTKGFSGATILGDGNVALILDIMSLF